MGVLITMTPEQTTQTTGRAVAATLVATAVLALVYAPGCGPPYRPLDGAQLQDLYNTAEPLSLAAPATGGHAPREMTLRTVESSTGAVVGYLAEGPVVSRSGPFIIRVAMTADARVIRAAVAHYPGARGGDVQDPRFTRQFEGRTASDPLRVGKDIDAVSGATLSSRAMAGGVRKALDLAQQRAATP